MKILTILITLILGIGMNTTNDSIFNYTMKDIDGKEVSLESYKGKVILVVNVASKCGYTPQYEGLQSLYETYKDEGLVVLGFPANNFKGQEPGSDEEIKQFCTLNYGVEFPMFSKVSVKGDDQDELFKYLTQEQNPDFTGEIKWNFEKFLINKEGDLIRRFRSNVEPESNEILDAVKSAL
ncbi:glutathione peroxidase [Gracilimonas amylolytica]|uniref:glutathione peroxidase n=1 Tax=Gracilimonas amylolytica TaxID=1749045 RepID=UPI000CD8A423|nr:glutathione peroxidase [Gracilimonas amylolytica]